MIVNTTLKSALEADDYLTRMRRAGQVQAESDMELALQSFQSFCQPLGPYLYDVYTIFGILDPLPPLSPLLCLHLGNPLPPSQCRLHFSMAPLTTHKEIRPK